MVCQVLLYNIQYYICIDDMLYSICKLLFTIYKLDEVIFSIVFINFCLVFINVGMKVRHKFDTIYNDYICNRH